MPPNSAPPPTFPKFRARRLRDNKLSRDLISEVKLSASDLVCPIFVADNLSSKRKAESLPGQYIYPVGSDLVKFIEQVRPLGIRSFLVFGIPKRKDEAGSEAYSKDGVVQRALRLLREAFGRSILAITDVCLCQYTSHGHCGIVRNGRIDNDLTLPYLAKIAVSHAEAGADMVAPSDMMDGRVKAIRDALDEAGFKDVGIMSYATKYASSLYGPFRGVVGSAPAFGDRRGYQMDPRNAREALLEAEADVAEGADIIMVKPALWYLDVIKLLREALAVPIAAFSVSGEYAMIKMAASAGMAEERRLIAEAMVAIKRAGADIIITYFAPQVAELLANGSFYEVF